MDKIKILFLAANPMNTSRLALDEELRDVLEKIRGAEHRDVFEMVVAPAARPDDIEQALLQHKPVVVHFSGHGSGTAGLVFQGDQEAEKKLVSADALGHLFNLLRKNVRVVVLNACYSDEQANAIVREIDYVVGMRDAIGDLAARRFAASFYRGLAFGETIDTAFGLGVNALKREGLVEDKNVPMLLVRSGVSAEVALLQSGLVPGSSLTSRDGPVLPAATFSQQVSFRKKANLALVDVSIVASDDRRELDIKLRNASDEVVFIKAVTCVTVARWNLPRPGARPSAMPITETYDIDVAPVVGKESFRKMSQVVRPNDVDRFAFSLGSRHSTYPFVGLFVFLLDIAMLYNEDGVELRLPRVLLHLPPNMELHGMFQGPPGRQELEHNKSQAQDVLAAIAADGGIVVEEGLVEALESWATADFGKSARDVGND